MTGSDSNLDEPSPAARLCGNCGMCCNGVLFHHVSLQPKDSAKELAGLGIKLKRRRGVPCIMQPCPAHRDLSCRIYHNRPERCRLFECQQIRRVAEGTSTEAEAMEIIEEARTRVAEVKELLRQAGDKNEKRALSTRLTLILAQPAGTDPELDLVREKLRSKSEELESFLQREFRTAKGAATSRGEGLNSASV